jgi:hypothetical protein
MKHLRTDRVPITLRWLTLLMLVAAAAACGSDDADTHDADQLPLSVEGLAIAEPTGQVSVVGFIVLDAGGDRLCEALAESFPPQCGGASVDIANAADLDVTLEESGAVRWTNLAVVLSGRYADGTFTIGLE